MKRGPIRTIAAVAGKAAQYVRMSTDMQKYSTDNQEAIIALYASTHGLDIVRTYADEGKSGLASYLKAIHPEIFEKLRADGIVEPLRAKVGGRP